MPKIRRWFHVSHDINADPEVWELTDLLGDRALRIWLELLSIADRNNGDLPGWSGERFADPSPQLRQSLAGRCRTTGETVRKACRFFGERLWTVPGTPHKVRNYTEYNRTREPNKIPRGNSIGSPPNLPNLPNLPNTPNGVLVGGEKSPQKRARKPATATPPNVETIREITLRYPPKHLWAELGKRAEGLTKEALTAAYTEWTMRGYSPANYSWLDWARNGIPAQTANGRGGGKSDTEMALDKAMKILRGDNDTIDITN